MGRNSVKRQSKRQSKRKQNRGKRTKIRHRGGGPVGARAFGVDEPIPRCRHEYGDKFSERGKEWYKCKKCGGQFEAA
jgi:hypothetical protein